MELKVLTDYLSVWFWMIISWISLINSFVFLVLDRYEWFGGLVGVFFLTFLISVWKKRRFEKEYG